MVIHNFKIKYFKFNVYTKLLIILQYYEVFSLLFYLGLIIRNSHKNDLH